MSLTTPASAPARIDWRCGTCGQRAHRGAVHIDLQRVRRAETAISQWNQRPRPPDPMKAFDLTEVLLAPRVEAWRVDCNRCIHNCVGCYSIDLLQCQSIHALIGWTAFLYPKTWFTATDWISFIKQVAQENGSPAEPTGVL